jgi:hypothetical protein
MGVHLCMDITSQKCGQVNPAVRLELRQVVDGIGAVARDDFHDTGETVQL